MPDVYKKLAIKKILIGQARNNVELWEADKSLSWEDLMEKVKDYARSKKLDKEAEARSAEWLTAQEAALGHRYEQELMNPKEALSLGSVSQIVMPSDLRQVLAEHMAFHLRHYDATPFAGIQREFH